MVFTLVLQIRKQTQRVQISFWFTVLLRGEAMIQRQARWLQRPCPSPPSFAARTWEGFVKPTTSCRQFSGRFPGLTKISHQVNRRSNQQPHPKNYKSMVWIRAYRSEHDSKSTELQAMQLSLKLSVQPEWGSMGISTTKMQPANDWSTGSRYFSDFSIWRTQSRMYTQSGSISFAKYCDQNVYLGGQLVTVQEASEILSCW